MPSCAAYGCSNRSSEPRRSTKQNKKEIAPKMTFHKFPKDPKRRNAWAKALRRADWIPNKNSVLCSTHFTEDAFDRTSLSCVRLRDTAVPSIFRVFPPHFQDVKKVGESTSPNVISEISPPENGNTMDVDELPSSPSTLQNYPVSSLPAVPSASSINVTTRTSSSQTSFSPHNRSVSSTELVLRQKLKQMRIRYQKKIKFLQQSERRHVRKIESLKNVLTTLKKQKFYQ